MILSIGKAVPSYSLSQAKLPALYGELMELNDEEQWLFEKIYKNSAISNRFSVLSEAMHVKQHANNSFTGMSERNALYRKEAPLLAERAAREALSGWSGTLTHLISVSCTGVISPGIEHLVARALNLPPDLSLLGINFMGCFGAFKALKVAAKIARENPKNRILVVCTELCTLHFKMRKDIESVVIQSLFADGSAAVIIGSAPQQNETVLFELLDEKSHVIPDTMRDMTWDASDEGFDMTLSARVPSLINDQIVPFVSRLTSAPLECEWAVHPGGKSIVETIEKTLCLDRSQVVSSWNVLNQFGNISSATILYVLEDIYKRGVRNKNVVGLGFGPGLSIEGLLLRC